MSNFNRSEEARRNRMSAMIDDDETAVVAASPAADPFDGRKQLREACSIRLDRIIPDPDQPRKEFEPEALARLAESLKVRGQLQPVRVRWEESRGVYIVVVGERRWRAAAMAGLQTLVCVVATGNPSAADLLEDQLVENALREDLKPVEQARSFRLLMGRLGLTQQQLAAKLQISQTTVSQSLTLLELPEPVRAKVDAGQIATSAAYQIAKMEDPEAQADLAARIVSEGLSRAETVKAVRQTAGRKAKGRGAKTRKLTSRVFRTPAGRVTVENSRGLTPESMRAALDAVRDTLDAEAKTQGKAAA